MKLIQKIGLTIIIIVLAFVLLKKINWLPNFGKWFGSKPLLIENTPVVVQSIKDLNELITMASYDEIVLSKTKEDNTPGIKKMLHFDGNKSISIIAKGKVLAGVTLNNITENNIAIVKDTITLTLPKASIISTIVNPSDCEIFIETGNWSTAEINQLKTDAITDIQQRATDKNILTKATVRATSLLQSFLQSMGFKKVEVRYN